MATKTVYTLHEDTIRKLKEDHQRLRGLVRNLQARVAQLNRPPAVQREDCIFGKFASQVAARSGTTMTSGELTVWVTDSDGKLTETTRTETAWNWTGGAITADKFVICHRDFKTGMLLAIAEDCA